MHEIENAVYMSVLHNDNVLDQYYGFLLNEIKVRLDVYFRISKIYSLWNIL